MTTHIEIWLQASKKRSFKFFFTIMALKKALEIVVICIVT
jgi:hypothetical protein